MRSILSWAFLLVAAIITGLATYSALYIYKPPTKLIYQEKPIVSDYPISMVLRSKEGDITIEHHVSYDLDAKLYAYHYNFTNISQTNILLNWEVLDQVRGEKAFIEIPANGNKNFDIGLQKRPTIQNGRITFMLKSGDEWKLHEGNEHAGPVPE